MQTDRSRRLAALALGAASIFDLTGAVIYRVFRSSLPPAPLNDAEGPFQQATRELRAAQREAVNRTRRLAGRDRDSTTLPA